MFRLRITVTLLWICFFKCYIKCDDSIYEHYDSYGRFQKYHKHDEPSGKALEDICDCDSIEIVTTKVEYSFIM